MSAPQISVIKMLSILNKPKREILISEPDIQLAITHLQGLPFSLTSTLPNQWGRQRILQCLREALDGIQVHPMNGRQCIPFAPGLWALIVPYGSDLADPSISDGRLQVWVLTRSVGTDPTAVSNL